MKKKYSFPKSGRWVEGKQPCPQAGQIWQECDNRFIRLVEIIVDASPYWVRIRRIGPGHHSTAHTSRFRGQHGGYRYIAKNRAELKSIPQSAYTRANTPSR